MGILSEEYGDLKSKDASEGGDENDIGEEENQSCWHFGNQSKSFKAKVMVDSIKRLWRVQATEARKEVSTRFGK